MLNTMIAELVIKAENRLAVKLGVRGHLHESWQRKDRHAPFIHKQIKSKLTSFDKSGAWLTHINFQPGNKHYHL